MGQWMIVEGTSGIRLMSPYEFSRCKKNIKVIGRLEKEYPSLPTLSNLKKNPEDFRWYLRTNIEISKKNLEFWSEQLSNFEDEIVLREILK